MIFVFGKIPGAFLSTTSRAFSSFSDRVLLESASALVPAMTCPHLRHTIRPPWGNISDLQFGQNKRRTSPFAFTTTRALKDSVRAAGPGASVVLAPPVAALHADVEPRGG